MSAPRPWWDELGDKRTGPARIRVSFNREFTEAEREHLRRLSGLVKEFVGDKLRLAPDDRLYVESLTSTSRELFDAVAAVVASSFVNVYPTAVRTFRELVKPQIKVESRPKNYAHGGIVITGQGLLDTIQTTNIAYEPRTQARQSTIDKVTRAVKDELDELGTKLKGKKKKARKFSEVYDDRG